MWLITSRSSVAVDLVGEVVTRPSAITCPAATRSYANCY